MCFFVVFMYGSCEFKYFVVMCSSLDLVCGYVFTYWSCLRFCVHLLILCVVMCSPIDLVCGYVFIY